MTVVSRVTGPYRNVFLAFVAILLLFAIYHSVDSTQYERLKHLPNHTSKDTHSQAPKSSNVPHNKPKSSAKPSKKVPPDVTAANATLDFEEIFYISLEERPDRQDQMSLIAAATGIKIKWFPAVDPKKFPIKGYPDGIPEEMKGNGRFGCWRSHANLWKHIIDNDISSALILEDDADWDMNIRQIMGRWHWQLKYNNTIRWGKDNVQKGWKEDCPYGCDWDELFVGQCFNSPNPNRLDLHQTYFDPDTPLVSQNDGSAQGEIHGTWNVTEDDSRLRIIAPTWAPTCTLGYAVSRMGAMRMLYNIGGMKPLNNNIDLEFTAKSKEGKLSGYTLVPAPFNMVRKWNSKDSDIDGELVDKPVEDDPTADIGYLGAGLANPARKGLEKLLDKNYWEDMEGKSVK